MKFIYTKDEKVEKQLRAMGFPFICKSGRFWVFENKENIQLNFEHEKGSFFFSDRLTFSGVF
ncbi:MAG: hypothetical protein J6S14_17325 [Clostridia bacterium]|nr:hypothetical protein [Clostridia bacterium]